MSELKNVLKRLQDEEVKLSSEKVELGILQDMKKATQDLKKKHKGARDNAEFIKSSLNRLNNDLNALFSSSTKSETILNKYEDMIKELGISPTSVKEYDELVELINDIKEDIKTWRKSLY